MQVDTGHPTPKKERSRPMLLTSSVWLGTGAVGRRVTLVSLLMKRFLPSLSPWGEAVERAGGEPGRGRGRGGGGGGDQTWSTKGKGEERESSSPEFFFFFPNLQTPSKLWKH